MKQTYEAPKLEVIAYSLHEAIAAGCSDKVYNHADGNSCTPTKLGDIIISSGVNFAEDNNCSVPVAGYCYFTSSSVLFNS